MKPVLFYDTETTGLPIYGEPSESPKQPHIVQIGALLADLHSRQVIERMEVLVRPDGWTIPEDVIAVHGITNEKAGAEGISEREALQAFFDMHARCEFRVGHNESFDARILRIGCKRYYDEAFADAWKSAPARCTMQASTPVLRLPATKGRSMYKPPKLKEVHEFLLKQDFEDAHTALADAEACMRVYFALRDLGAV